MVASRAEARVSRVAMEISLRWRFSPEQSPGASVRWRWKAFDDGDRDVRESHRSFETLSDCISDARDNGYPEADASTTPA
jgi:hypothetical protein